MIPLVYQSPFSPSVLCFSFTKFANPVFELLEQLFEHASLRFLFFFLFFFFSFFGVVILFVGVPFTIIHTTEYE